MPLVFSHDFFPFFNIENYYQCVLYFVFIGDKAIHFVVEILPVHALVCSGLRDVFRTNCTKKNLSCLFQIEWYHLIVKAVAKCVFKSNRTV